VIKKIKRFQNIYHCIVAMKHWEPLVAEMRTNYRHQNLEKWIRVTLESGA